MTDCEYTHPAVLLDALESVFTDQCDKILNLMHKHATLQTTKQLPQCFQALVYSQGVSQNSSFLVSNFTVPETIEERTLSLVEVP